MKIYDLDKTPHLVQCETIVNGEWFKVNYVLYMKCKEKLVAFDEDDNDEYINCVTADGCFHYINPKTLVEPIIIEGTIKKPDVLRG